MQTLEQTTKMMSEKLGYEITSEVLQLKLHCLYLQGGKDALDDLTKEK